MRRRRFLESASAGVATGIAGCLSWIEDDAEIAITDINRGPEKYGLEFDAELDKSTLSGDDPPRLDLQFRNGGEYEIAYFMWGDYRVGNLEVVNREDLPQLPNENATAGTSPHWVVGRMKAI